MFSVKLARLLTALIPVKRVRRRLRQRLMASARDAWLAKTVPLVRARYAEHARECREKLARGEKLRVCFLVCDVSMFSAEPVYTAMLQDVRFEPFIAVAPRVSRGEQFLRETMACTVETLEARYGKVVRLYDPDTKAWGRLEGRADVVVTTVVYDGQTDARFTAEPMSRYALVACISYGYSGQLAHDERSMIFLPQFALFWRLFITNPATRAAWVAANPRLDYNLAVGGYAKMDRLATIQPRANRPKTILLCPHHSLERGADGLALSNFLTYADFLLELPTMFPEVRFVFRPHPLLFPRLATDKWWGAARTEEYRRRLSALPNVEFQQGGDYFETFVNSDAMIHDCGSFQAEYLYTGHPQCFVVEDDAMFARELTPFGRRLHEHLYHARTRDEMVDFVRRVVLAGEDPLADARTRFAADEVCLYHPHASAQVLAVLLGGVA